MSATAESAGPLASDKLYQERARAALPLLVRQASAAKPIFYSALAGELGMPNPRNLIKKYVAKNSLVLGLPKSTPIGTTEFQLPSGDSLNVSFRTRRSWVAAEAKSQVSDQTDLVRGAFQCDKYQAT